MDGAHDFLRQSRGRMAEWSKAWLSLDQLDRFTLAGSQRDADGVW
jgi:hypothetical protein